MPLFILVALLIAPFGRAQAQAPAPAHDAPATAMAGHCDPVAPSTPAPPHHGSIDCMIACAAMPAFSAALGAHLPPLAPAIAPPAIILHGIQPESEPPPPRLS